MNLRQLEYFLVVARTGSFTAAAAELQLAQPTLTKSIKGLEGELGATLFERLPRGVTLTLAGAVLKRHAERVDVQVSDAVKELKAITSGANGHVSIGAGPAWLRRLLPEAVASAVTDNPALRVRVLGGFDDVLLKALRAGELDFVVAELPAEENAPDLELEALTSDHLHVFCRASHPLAGGGPIAMAELLPYPWVMPPASTRAQQRLNALFATADLPSPRISVETESMAFLLNMLAGFDALTFTVSSTARLVEADGLVLLDVPEISAERAAGLIKRRGSWLSPAAGAVIEALKRQCARHERN